MQIEDLRKKLLPFQPDGINHLVEHKKAFLADEQGLGKTVQTIVALEELGIRKALILCTASLKFNWFDEIKKWTFRNRKIHIVTASRETIPQDTDIIICNYDLAIRPQIYKQLTSRRYGACICDEAHYLKNFRAKRTKAVLSKTGIIHKATYQWFLSGTPLTNRPIELWSILRSVAPEVIKPYTGYAEFAYRYCAAYNDGFGLNVRGASNIEELNRRLFGSGFMFRRLKKHVLKDLPPKIMQILPVDAGAEGKKIIKMQQKLSPATLNKLEIGHYDLGELAELRRKEAIAKIPMSIKHVTNTLENVDKVVVFAYHKTVIDALSKELTDKGINNVTLTGSTSQGDRQVAVKKFQTDPNTRVFIGNILAAGVGLTLTAASNVVFLETSWTPGDIAQAVDRCHRIGQQDTVLAQFLVIKGSLEEHILRTALVKSITIKKLLKQG